METTDGVTSEEIDFVFMALPPISTRVLDVGHVPFCERKIACVRLSAQTLRTLVEFVEAVATDPAMAAPATKAAITLMFFMDGMLP
jgi:hypothetical protein